MPLEAPRLDDRTFDELLRDAKHRLRERCPEWTDASDSDPGIVLLELFAYLTDTMLYRLNRVPDKVYVELLKLMGVRLAPPAAAATELTFSRLPGHSGRIDVPRGTRVAAARPGSGGPPVVFATDRDAHLAPGAERVVVGAHHAELVPAEEIGRGTGRAGLTLALRRAPVVAPTGLDDDLVVAVELDEAEEGGDGVVAHDGSRFRVWREVETFAGHEGERVYRADRQAGLVHFAPALGPSPAAGAIAAVPGEGRRVLAWYRRGGGAVGTVGAGTLTLLQDAVPGVTVTNERPAQGGRDEEELASALARGPQVIHSLQRAVTARDFELVALSSDRAVARALAVTSAAHWRHAAPGEAEVVIVPAADAEGGRLDAATLRTLERETVVERVLAELDRRRPLGSRCRVSWAQYKTVRVGARVVAERHADLTALRRRVLARLHGTISPLPTGDGGRGWEFGKTLRASHVYEVALREPGVVWVDRVRLRVDEVPGGEVRSLSASATQAGVWFAATRGGLFRTLNDGAGWEAVAKGQLRPGEEPMRVCAHPSRPGLLAVVTRLRVAGATPPETPDGPGAAAPAPSEAATSEATTAELAADGPTGPEPTPEATVRSRVLFSRTAGEDWEPHFHDLGFEVEDAAWVASDAAETLLLATDAGLFRLSAAPGASPELVPVGPEAQDMPLYAVASADAGDGDAYVAVAAQRAGGVYLAARFPRDTSFRRLAGGERGALGSADVRVLGIQHDAGARFLWAGTAALGSGDPGSGALRWRLRGDQDAPEGWQAFSEGWRGGSCLGLAFGGAVVLAATYRRGVARLDTRSPEPAWEDDINSGLTRTGDDGFPVVPVTALAAGGDTPVGFVVMAGAGDGVHRSVDGGRRFASVSGDEFRDRVTLPPTWLFCSGEHELEVVRVDEATEDAPEAAAETGGPP